MHYRNLAAIDTEAMLTAQPMDAAVLIGGCDKTVPAQLMAAASADIPAVQLVTGPMLATPFQGERLVRLHRLPALLGGLSRRAGNRRADRRDRGPACHHRRHLRRHGHCLHHGLHRRSAGHGAVGARLDPGGARRPFARRGRCRCVGGAADRTADPAVGNHHAGVGGKCPARAAGAGRIHQRADPSDGGRRPARHQNRPAPAERTVRYHAGAGGSETDRRGLYGGFPRCRRHARAAVGIA